MLWKKNYQIIDIFIYSGKSPKKFRAFSFYSICVIFLFIISLLSTKNGQG